ncbi:MAG: superoxide dismutase family protein [Acutalibacteraceae bacterium]
MNRNCLHQSFSGIPDAVALMKGSKDYPGIHGSVRFYRTVNGVIVRAEIMGLPKGKGGCDSPIFAFHIHEGSECAGDEKDSFAKTKGHLNPDDCSHPYHAGDLPPLFSANGRACSAFLTDRFSIREILGRTVIIHRMPDDFKTQPSGNAGEKIACGVVMQTRR